VVTDDDQRLDQSVPSELVAAGERSKHSPFGRSPIILDVDEAF
jgi:hypothetical protein